MHISHTAALCLFIVPKAQWNHTPVSFFTMFPVGIIGFTATAGVATGT